MDFSTLQLPEWMTVSAFLSGATTVILFIVALIKLASAAKQSKANNETLTSTLLNVLTTLSDVRAEMEKIKESSKLFETNTKDILSKSCEQISICLNLAEFVSSCFNMANLSDDNKRLLKSLYDRLFHENSELIDSLTTNNEALSDELTKLKADLIAAQETIAAKQAQLDSAKRTVRKTRHTI